MFNSEKNEKYDVRADVVVDFVVDGVVVRVCKFQPLPQRSSSSLLLLNTIFRVSR